MSKSFWDQINKPIIGLAPMDGYTDSAFRRVCKTVNPAIITYTEFTSADGLHFNVNKLKQKLCFDPSEQPIVAQIFGKNPETFIRAAKICEDMGFCGIDINMGCPSRRVVKSEHGIALRKKPELAFKLIETVAQNTSLPVSVKTRLGLQSATDLVPFGKGAQNAGANMICIHGRTYAHPYKTPAQFEPIYELKQALSIPVLGNGGITDISDGLKKMGNLDGFLIGQATFGNPWVFSATPALSFSEKLPLIKLHADYLIQTKGEKIGCREIRKHLLQYIKGFRQAKAFRSQLVSVESYTEIETILDHIHTHYDS